MKEAGEGIESKQYILSKDRTKAIGTFHLGSEPTNHNRTGQVSLEISETGQNEQTKGYSNNTETGKSSLRMLAKQNNGSN